MKALVLFNILSIFLLGHVYGLSPVCRTGGRLRSDLNFKYAYKESVADSSKDIDFSQRAGESIRCNAAGTDVTADGVTLSVACESVSRSEGPGMDRFGWAKQLAVSSKGSVKVYAGDLNGTPTEFTSGDECGSTIRMSLGSQYMAAVCRKAVRVYRYDGTTWTDHDEISFPSAVDHELKVDLNHEDYLIVSEPSTTTVKIYKLGAVTHEEQSLTGDGTVAAAVNCRGPVFAYESGGVVKMKQKSQKDGSWSDLADIEACSICPVSMSASNDVLALGYENSVYLYMFANSGTEYALYKSMSSANNFGRKVRIEHDDLAVLDDTRLYFFDEGPSTKCRELQKLVDGTCVDCGEGHTNGHDNAEGTCNAIQCLSTHYALNKECKACPAGATGVAGPATIDSVCTCAPGVEFNATDGTCTAILCAENELVAGNACAACPAGTTNVAGDDASGANTTCDATLCAENEHVVDNVCTPCVEGSTNVAGDDASGANTACDANHQCLVNQFYDTVNHCQSCPAGTEKAVAVDSTGGNSTCDDIVCVENHFVGMSYSPDNTKKYGSTSCTGTSDCETKCTADSGCAGYTNNGFSTVKAWGSSTGGGTDPGVINNVADIVPNAGAFAALKSDGSITAWGSSTYGGTGAPTGTGYTQIFANDYNGYTFAALKSDGSITAWGNSNAGGTGEPTDTGYVKIFANTNAFAALKSDGSIKAWGQSSSGGTGAPTDTGYTQIFFTHTAFAAMKADGSITAWGNSNAGGTGAPTGTGYTQIYSASTAFAALKSDGSITVWGSSGSGGSGAPTDTGYTQIFSNYNAFAAMKSDGSIKAWGYYSYGGSGAPTDTGYVDIVSTSGTFAALKNDGSIFAWGDSTMGGTGEPTGTGYTQIFSSHAGAFAALKNDGSVTVWGNSDYGGTDPSISSGVANIYSTHTAFVAVGPSSLAYGPEVAGTGASVTKGKECTACHANATRPAGDLASGSETQCACNANFEGDGSSCTPCGANQESAGGEDTCKCSSGFEGDGTQCVACPANSTVAPGPVADSCVKNEEAIWYDEVVNGPADAGACTSSLVCSSKAGDPSTCTQPYEDGGVLQVTTPCCKIQKPLKCGCNENYRVKDNACIACPTGEVRFAGDNPDNGDTFCNTEGITLAFGHNGNTDFVYDGQNDPEISLKAGYKYTFLRVTEGHPLRIVSAADCPSCSTGTYDSLPTSSLTSVDSVQGVSSAVFNFKEAGTYYYVCTAHPSMVGKLTVAWDACSMDTYGSILLDGSCEIQSTVSLTGATSINVASARLRSTEEKIMLSMSSSISPAINAGVYALTINGVEITDVKTDAKMVESTTGTITLKNVDLKDNPRNTMVGSMFKTDGGHIIGESLVVENNKGELFEGVNGGDISMSDSIISGSGNIIKQNGGAVLVRDVNVTGGDKLADLVDATSIFEAVVTDGGDGISAIRSGVQVERSTFKNHAAAPIQYDSRGCTDCKRELLVQSSVFEDAAAVSAQTDVGNKPKVKMIETSFTSGGVISSDNGIELYVIDEVEGSEMTTTETKTETCLPYQCSHKPLATSCKVQAGKGTKCICDVGVATYKVEENELDKQTTVEEILSMLFATADTADRVVKLVDQNVRYIPTQATPEEAKSNILLLKPTNADGEFQSEKTILLKPDTGSVCATFQTWLCAELTACHYANGTITADCDGNKILTGSSNAARRFRWKGPRRSRLRGPHPDDPNCNGPIVNLKQQCSDANGAFYSRCVQYAQFHHDKCICMPGMLSNANGDACILEDNLCKVNERVQDGACVPCADGLTNKAGDDLTGVNTVCDDVICKEGLHSDGNGRCVLCPTGSYNLEGDIAFDGTTSTNGPATSCCPSGQYEFDVDITTGTRVCKACDDATDSLRNRFGANGAGLSCCRGTRLTTEDAFKCDRILAYYKKICQPLEANANTCKTY